MRALLALVAISAIGCAHSKIPQTNIDDTPENREILEIVTTYKNAMESLDADAIISLVSPRYFENNGNTDRGDDYDYAQLREQLARDFDRTKRIQLLLRIDNIVVEEDKAYAYIQFTYRAQSEYPAGMKWKTDSDKTRIEFENSDGKWLIIAGL